MGRSLAGCQNAALPLLGQTAHPSRSLQNAPSNSQPAARFQHPVQPRNVFSADAEDFISQTQSLRRGFEPCRAQGV
ncbi:hypothetical protein BD289DRAFT_429301 [Coniella lustricola]|uniref:Uncharacterized protein n=1 Tax=Coniella lustricola TaxID=2025994 RepID=A0A2T3AD56_9PEZI|nr:hypothetical protein BD289DRAFT_429301 [Coniella lustricola]